MGRTNPTYREQVRSLRRQWGRYRRALRRSDQPHFDRLFDHAAAHADAGGAVNATDPVVPTLLSIALEHEKRLAELESESNPAEETE